MTKKITYISLFTAITILFFGCDGCKEKTGVKPPVVVDTNKKPLIVTGNAPRFHPDSAFMLIEKQLSFGPRNPGSSGHKKCGDFLISFLKEYADEVIEQKGNVRTYTNESYEARNIMARFNTENPNRVLLCAHWDTRPFNDQEPGGGGNKPIPGADDGGSGVAVLLQIARVLSQKSPNVGVDIVLFDMEDYGDAGGNPDSYCLGSQYWAQNLPVQGYTAKWGILLDMVGAKNARFLKEGYSVQANSYLVERVWQTAASLGYAAYFPNQSYSGIVDDHIYVYKYAKIPTIDILNFDPTRIPAGFGQHWHTLNDDIGIIDTTTLKAVGQTVLEVVYNE